MAFWFCEPGICLKLPGHVKGSLTSSQNTIKKSLETSYQLKMVERTNVSREILLPSWCFVHLPSGVALVNFCYRFDNH